MFTPEYIKMCREAKEIQELRCCNWKPGDFWFDCYEKINVLGNEYDGRAGRTGGVFLPTQDQLQDMVKDKFNHLFDLLYKFYWFVEDMVDTDEWFAIKERTLEISWLEFIMHELYKKKWDGEAWVDFGIG
jgi:hypothetical protein